MNYKQMMLDIIQGNEPKGMVFVPRLDILGIADTTPADANFDRIRYICEKSLNTLC